jgi:alkylation response protein AidB-like acyl-CoA dehydrogenase
MVLRTPEGKLHGFADLMNAYNSQRVGAATVALGLAQGAFETGTAFAKERQQFGRPIGEFQGLQWMLADMATELDASRLLGLRAAQLRAAGARFSQEASMAKLFASEMAGRVTDKALQIHGGYGYARQLPLERFARDVRVMRIYEGSSEIQRNIIARTLLG